MAALGYSSLKLVLVTIIIIIIVSYHYCAFVASLFSEAVILGPVSSISYADCYNIIIALKFLVHSKTDCYDIIM